jgi:flagellar motor protein MotB
MCHRWFSIVAATAALLATAPVAAWAQSQLPPPSGAQQQRGQPLPPPSSAQQQQPQRGQQLPPPQRGAQPAPAQQQQRPAQQAPQQQQAAPVGPYKAVSVKDPEAMNDPSLEAFRKQIEGIADRKDRRALAPLISQNFFWTTGGGEKANKRQPGIENLAKALGLAQADGSGWDALFGFVSEPTGSPHPDRKDTICSPGDPVFSENEFEELIKATGTEEEDWGIPAQDGLEMRATAQPNSAVVEKLGLHFVRVLEDSTSGNAKDPMLKVVSPAGKTGFVPADAIMPLGNDQICYAKEGGNWKIVGFIGGEG